MKAPGTDLPTCAFFGYLSRTLAIAKVSVVFGALRIMGEALTQIPIVSGVASAGVQDLGASRKLQTGRQYARGVAGPPQLGRRAKCGMDGIGGMGIEKEG